MAAKVGEVYPLGPGWGERLAGRRAGAQNLAGRLVGKWARFAVPGCAA